jgi:TolB-like protein
MDDIKKFFFFLALLFFSACALRPPSVSVHSKPGVSIRGGKLGILPFQCLSPPIGVAVSDVTAANLLGSPFSVIERSYLSQVLQEQGYSVTGITENPNLEEIGKLSGVDYLLVGNVTILSQRRRWIIEATARIVDVKTGEIVLAVLYKPRSDNDMLPQPTGEALAVAIRNETMK